MSIDERQHVVYNNNIENGDSQLSHFPELKSEYIEHIRLVRSLRVQGGGCEPHTPTDGKQARFNNDELL